MELFRKIAATHGQSSADALRSYLLLNESFSEAGAKQFIGAFQNTLAVTKWDMETYIPPEVDQREEQSPNIEERERNDTRDFMELFVDKAPATGLKEPHQGGSLWFKVPFGNTELKVRIEVAGDSLKREHVAKVRKYLELAEDDLPQPAVVIPPTPKEE